MKHKVSSKIPDRVMSKLIKMQNRGFLLLNERDLLEQHGLTKKTSQFSSGGLHFFSIF